MMGIVSVVALAVNLMLLVALLSMLQATLTLPGIAAIALTLGMAIDANVLINERIREELRNGTTPQAAIHAGYERAWATILDSNITTLIAGIALFMFGTGPVRGFAVVHCLGILTSMFSAVLVSRAMVNLTFGRKKRLERLPIGNVDWQKSAPSRLAPAGPRAVTTDNQSHHGILPDPPRHRLHEARDGIQHHLAAGVPAVGVLQPRRLHLGVSSPAAR
jgi:uncharacterized membrane protein YdfJ with MMPL/SSD domain